MPDYKYPKASKKLSKEEEKAVVARAREFIEDVYVFERDNRREAEIDLQFVAGDQWPAAVKAARGTTRPMLTINQLPQFVQLVTNPTREADIGIKAVPVDDAADPETAKIYNSIIQDIEYLSTAKTVYVTGNEHQAKCGIGWWRVCSQYVDDAVFDQELRIKRINNPLAVYCDTAAVEPDRSDAMAMAVVENWPRKAFKKKYPNASEQSIDVPNNAGAGTNFQWSSQDVVAVAEYYEKVPKKKLLAQLGDGSTVDITGKGEGELGELDAQQTIVGVREVDTYQVKKYLVSGLEVLEGPIDWPGKYIPLIPVLGAETPLKSGTMRYGVVRFARDPQQLMNFYRTATAEAIALSPKAPYLVTLKQIGPHKQAWDTLNTENRPYLPYTPDPDAPGIKPAREHPPETPEALMREANIAAEDLQRVTGIYPASMGARSNETSGVAIGQRQSQTDTANSHYADNLMHSLVHTGRVLIDLIPHIYDNERVLRIKGQDGKESKVTINKVLYVFNGQEVMQNDLSAGRFDVRVTVGRNYITKRIETLNALLEMTKSLPPQAQLLMLDLIVKNMDFPDSEELVKRFRSLIPPEALADPNDPNAPKPPGPMDDPMMVAQLEELAAKIEDLKKSAGLKEAQRIKTLAEADATDAETGQIVMPQIIGAGQDGATPAEPPPEPPSGFEGGALQA